MIERLTQPQLAPTLPPADRRGSDSDSDSLSDRDAQDGLVEMKEAVLKKKKVA